MKFDISTRAFIQLINTLTAAGEKRNSFMILKYTRIIADENAQTVRFERHLFDTLGSNMSGTLTTTVLVQQPHVVVYEGGDVLATIDKANFAINAAIKKQCEIARFDGDKVQLLQQNDTPLRMVPLQQYGDLSEWPELPSDETSDTFATGLHNLYLKQAFTHTSDDGARPEFLCVRMGKDGLLCSTDGHRLALIKTDAHFPDGDKADDVLIRPLVYKIIKTIPDDYTWDLFLGCNGQLELYTEIAGTIVTIRQSKSNGLFPDFTRVIPDRPMDHHFHIGDAKDVIDGLKAALKAYPMKSTRDSVKLCEDGSLVVRIEGKDYPTTVKITPTKGQGGSVCVNGKYLIDALALTGDDTTWSFIEEDTPTLLESKDGRTTVVVMPMQP